MNMSRIRLAVISSSFLLSSFSVAAASPDQQAVTITSNTQIPGAQLKAGSYTFAIEDRLADRAVVRVSNVQDPTEHYFVLAVPNAKLTADSPDHFRYFKTATGTQSVQAWQCADCPAPLEFVYAKGDAVKLTADSAQSVMAVDPSYDKLPSNLSPDDMKVVTLWLLSPQRVTANNTGEGVSAAKFNAAAAVPPPAPEAAAANQPGASAPAPEAATPPQVDTTPQTSAAPNPTAADSSDSSRTSVHVRHHLPKTASNAYLYALLGLVLLGGAIGTRSYRSRLS